MTAKPAKNDAPEGSGALTSESEVDDEVEQARAFKAAAQEARAKAEADLAEAHKSVQAALKVEEQANEKIGRLSHKTHSQRCEDFSEWQKRRLRNLHKLPTPAMPVARPQGLAPPPGKPKS